MTTDIEDRIRAALDYRAKSTDLHGGLPVASVTTIAPRRRRHAILAAAVAVAFVAATAGITVLADEHITPNRSHRPTALGTHEAISVYPVGGGEEVAALGNLDPERLVQDYLADRAAHDRFPISATHQLELGDPFPITVGDVQAGQRPQYIVDDTTRLIPIKLTTDGDTADGTVAIRRLTDGRWYVIGASTAGFHVDDLVNDGRHLTGRVISDLGADAPANTTVLVAYNPQTGVEIGDTTLNSAHPTRFTLEINTSDAIDLRIFNAARFGASAGQPESASFAYAETLIPADGQPYRVEDFKSLCGGSCGPPHGAVP